MTTPKKRGPKDLAGKRDWSIFPFREAGPVADVFEYGVKKYGRPFSYRDGIPYGELLAAIVRHVIQIQEGRDLDEESGLPHAAHIAANALMILSSSRKVEPVGAPAAHQNLTETEQWIRHAEKAAKCKFRREGMLSCLHPVNVPDGLCCYDDCPL